MNSLPPTTKTRLRKIPQNGAVWEGDRRSLSSISSLIESDLGSSEECIMWVDGSEGSVRVMEMVSSRVGSEAVVRALLKAIQSPHHPAQPARPSKIVVRDRELQFFLRGALQDLEIKIEYAAELPLIDELFRGFEAMATQQSLTLPEGYLQLLKQTATKIWHDATWELLADSDILTVEIPDSDLETIHICVMGMMSAEYGILMYRSLDSLKQFRTAAISEKNSEALEQAFLAQDCWFLNYEPPDESWNSSEAIEEVEPLFGSLHPFEGMRASLDETEAEIVYLVLEALHRFSQDCRSELRKEDIPLVQRKYSIDLPKVFGEAKKQSVAISTHPELTAELLTTDREQYDFETEEEESLEIHEDLIPDGSLVTMGQVSWNLLEMLKQQSKTHYQDNGIVAVNNQGLPAILIQTSRPKATAIVQTLKAAGGLRGICFNPGSDPFTEEGYDLGLLQTEDLDLYLFAEYPHSSSRKTDAITLWKETVAETMGQCCLIVTMGITGASKGNPQPKDMLAVFEAEAIAGDEIGLGVLRLMPEFE